MFFGNWVIVMWKKKKKKRKNSSRRRVRQQNRIVSYYYTTTKNSRLINSMTKLGILKWTYSDKDHKGNALSSLLTHGRGTQIKEKWQNKHNLSKSATSLQFWNAPSEITVWFVLVEAKRRSPGWKSHVPSTTNPQPPSLLGLCWSVYYVGWSSWSDQLLLLRMDSHGLSLKSGRLLIQTVKGPLCFCMRRRGTWQNVAVWRPGNETESVNSAESGKCQKTGRLKTLSSWKVTPVSDVSRLLNNIT